MPTEWELPAGWDRSVSCFFTGHRTIGARREPALREAVRDTVLRLYGRGFRFFFCGGAMGFDMLAEQEIVKLAGDCPEAALCLALPCADQTARWKDLSRIREYQRLKGLASWIGYAETFYTGDCMRARNAFMVEHTSVGVAYYDGALSGGTAQTVRMANRAGVPLLNLYQAGGGAG